MFQYGYGLRRRLSSLPHHLTAPNGLNFTKSVNNPNSRLNRVRKYLAVRGEATKREILRDVFGKEINDNKYVLVNGQFVKYSPNTVTHGWGTYLFGYGVLHGFFKKVRRGNTVYWSLNEDRK